MSVDALRIPPADHEVLELLRKIGRDELELTVPIELHTRLAQDLSLDSVGLVVVAVGLENQYRVRLDEADAGALQTIGDLVKLVQRRVGESRG